MLEILGVLALLAIPVVVTVGLIRPALVMPGVSHPTRWLLVPWAIVLFIASSLFFAFGQGARPNAETAAAPAVAQKTVTAPAEERAFVQAVIDARAAYGDAPNELKKSNVKIDMVRAMHAAVPGDRAVGWYGTLRRLGTNGDGDGIVEIEIQPGITVSTWNNSLSDFQDHTLIRNRSPVYNAVSDLAEGAVVAFDAQLLHLSDLTEHGSVEQPDMIARFSRIEAVK